MIHVKGELSAQEVVPKFGDIVDHTEGFTFGGGVVLFHGQEPSAGVIYGPILGGWCTLHEGASDGHVRGIYKHVKRFGPNRGLDHRGVCPRLTSIGRGGGVQPREVVSRNRPDVVSCGYTNGFDPKIGLRLWRSRVLAHSKWPSLCPGPSRYLPG